MAKVIEADINIPTGSQEFGPANIPGSAERFVIRFARCTDATPQWWPDINTLVVATVLISTDNGQTFPYTGGSMGARGGITIGLDGNQLPESSFVATVPAGKYRAIRAKAVVDVTNGPLVSHLTVEIS